MNESLFDVMQGNPLRAVCESVVAPRRFVIRLIHSVTGFGVLQMSCCDEETRRSAFLHVHSVKGQDVLVSIVRNERSKKCVTCGSFAISYHDNSGNVLCSRVVHVHEEPKILVVNGEVKVSLAAHFALRKYDEARNKLQKQILLWYLNYCASNHKASDKDVQEAAALLASYE